MCRKRQVPWTLGRDSSVGLTKEADCSILLARGDEMLKPSLRSPGETAVAPAGNAMEKGAERRKSAERKRNSGRAEERES